MTRILLAAITFIATFCSCGTTRAEEEKKTGDSTATTTGITVLLDNYFNNEWKDENGARVAWHYLWSDTSMGGYSELGELFKKKELHWQL
ncbi:hypothetical protein LWM68_36000 [Niabella sp. W65]|nr:hypothetical protein [Niabella sp. W65]MCH7367685.1 hypothetical protein [Niabella sp. W65]ULT43374.1 hypothetical protein KRR40_07965 [Niabella sp. I65]